MKPLLRLLLCLWFFAGGGAFAQTAPDYDAWRAVANRADEAVEAGRASDLALEQLRSDLVGWRQQFTQAQTTNRNAIQTVQGQLATLGTAPEDGSEPADIASQRAELTARLAELQTPVRTAEVAYTEAEGLIRGVDAIIRARQTEQLLELGPSPLNPTHWTKGLAALGSSLNNMRVELRAAWDNPRQQIEFRENTPKTLALLILALALLTRGRSWIARLGRAIEGQGAGQGNGANLAAAVLSLGQVGLPYLGLLALIEALYATELVGLRGELLLGQIPWAGFILLSALWLGARCFPPGEQRRPLLTLSPLQRRLGRLYAGLMGLILAADYLIRALANYDNWSDAALAEIYLPIFVLAGVMLWRTAALLLRHDGQGESFYAERLLPMLARALTLVAVIGPVLAAVGYFNAAHRLMIPTLASLLVFAFVLVLQQLAFALFAWLTGSSEEEKGNSLIPVLVGFLLSLAALPVLALIWGTRPSELIELWTTLSKGFAIGDARISPSDFLTFALVFGAGYTLTRLLQGTMKNSILPKTRLDLGGQNAVVAGLGYIGVFLAALIAITAAGIDLSSIALVAGALSVGIGFGLQNVVSNFVSGIILLVERPVSEGDWIEVNGHMGYVRNISVRSTRIETFDRTDVIVPNADLVSGTVTNFTRGNTIGRVIVPVGVAYGTDVRRVEAILMEIATSHPMVLADPAPGVIFQGFGASSLDFEIRAILRDVNWVLTVRSEMNFEIARRFEEEGIEIPFAQTDLWLRNPEALGLGNKKGQGSPNEEE